MQLSVGLVTYLVQYSTSLGRCSSEKYFCHKKLIANIMLLKTKGTDL